MHLLFFLLCFNLLSLPFLPRHLALLHVRLAPLVVPSCGEAPVHSGFDSAIQVPPRRSGRN